MHIRRLFVKCVQNSWVNRSKAFFIGAFGAITTVTISPYSGDAYNYPKLLALVVFAGISTIILLLSVEKFQEFRNVLILGFTFIVVLFLVLIFSGAKLSDQIMGAFGRNTGLIAYLCLALILMTSAILSSQQVLSKTLHFLLVAGSLSTLYAILQRFNADPFPTFTIYRPIISFFGNPDFQSAFSAITLIGALGMLFVEGSSLALRIFLFVYIEATIFVIFETRALQGIIVSAIGILIFFGIRIFTDTNYFGLKKAYSVFVPIISLLSIAGALNHGPFSTFLYKDSVAARGDYWRAGIKMVMDNPFFGVGLDTYGKFYEASRDARTIARGNLETADAAHNVFIDFAANGGLILFLTYLSLTIYTVYKAFKVIQNSECFDPYLAALVAMWIGYLAQSLISINQLGIAVWGWIFAGLIIGYPKFLVKA